MGMGLISWHVFFKVLARRPQAGVDEWIAKWRFADEGAYLLRPPVELEHYLRQNVETKVFELSILGSMNCSTVH